MAKKKTKKYEKKVALENDVTFDDLINVAANFKPKKKAKKKKSKK